MKSIKIIAICFLCMLLLTQNAFAISDTLETGQSWTNAGKNNAKGTMDSEQLADASSRLYYMLLAVATAVALIAGVMLGIKYMTAGIEEKVQVKESLLPYIVSSIIVFGSLGIWRLMISILGNL